jgi:hypothetical protein
MRHLLFLALLASPQAVSAMPASDFVARWTALAKLGRAALTTPDFAAVTKEVGSAAAAYRAEINEAQMRGRVPRACPPARVSTSLDDLVTEIRKLPETAQRQELGVVFGSIMDQRYPCSTKAPPQAPTTA